MHVLNFSDMWNMEIFAKDFLNVLNTLYLYHIIFNKFHCGTKVSIYFHMTCGIIQIL